ncbi:hypothetical protein ACJMQP_28000, partial [Rhodopseudomonas palustris]
MKDVKWVFGHLAHVTFDDVLKGLRHIQSISLISGFFLLTVFARPFEDYDRPVFHAAPDYFLGAATGLSVWLLLTWFQLSYSLFIRVNDTFCIICAALLSASVGMTYSEYIDGTPPSIPLFAGVVIVSTVIMQALSCFLYLHIIPINSKKQHLDQVQNMPIKYQKAEPVPAPSEHRSQDFISIVGKNFTKNELLVISAM